MEKNGEESLNPFNVFDKVDGSSTDLFFSDAPNNAASSKSSRFQPKSKFKPKPKPEPKIEPEAESEPEPLPQPKQEQVQGTAAAMDADEAEDDCVVREIDVFFTPAPLDNHAQLYVMQYPLRPCWRPYELNERCQEVRVNPKQSKLEVDLDMNFAKENYDDEVAEPMRLQKQTLSSSKAPFVTGYAVGILVQNKLHLNPVHAVVQLRPSMKYLDAGRMQKKNKAAGSSEVTANSDEGKVVSRTPNETNANEGEPWVTLEYHGMSSLCSSRYRQKMATTEGSLVKFPMALSDYVNSLCPGRPTENSKAKGPSRRILLSLPLDERFRKWFSEGSDSHVLQFDGLVHLAPGNSEDDVLKVIQQYAVLVQGLWVAKSSLLYSGVKVNARNYILLLFSKSRFIHHKELKVSKIPLDTLRDVLSPLAVERPACEDWKFRNADESFEKRHSDIVKEQKEAWSRRENSIKDAVLKNAPTVTKNSLKPTGTAVPNNTDQGTKGIKGAVSSGSKSMSAETLEALPKALLELFRIHKVCSLQLICQGLRDMAVSKTYLPKVDQRVALAAIHGASAPLPELQDVINEVAINIHGVYVLKSLGIASIDPLRNVVISLFSAKGPNAKLKRADIIEAGKIALNREISSSEYSQVVNELCVSVKGGAWVLKSGDGKPK